MAMANVHYLITQPSWMMNTNTRAAAATISLEKLNYDAVIFSPCPVGSDIYLVFNQHQLSLHRAHAH